MNFNFAVITPIIQISTLPIDQLYTGTSVLLICTFEINSRVDTEVRVDGIWRRGGEVLNNQSRVTITEVTLIEPFIYQTNLSINPLSDVLDGGQYSCETDATSDSFVLFSDAYQQVVLRIEGNSYISKVTIIRYHLIVYLVLPALPSPAITITSLGDAVVGENYTLNCTVSVLEGIVGNVILNSTWTNVSGHPLQSDLTTTHGASASFMLHFSPLYASHGGQYICNASVTVPELSVVKKSSQTYDVIVQSK